MKLETLLEDQLGEDLGRIIFDSRDRFISSCGLKLGSDGWPIADQPGLVNESGELLGGPANLGHTDFFTSIISKALLEEILRKGVFLVGYGRDSVLVFAPPARYRVQLPALLRVLRKELEWGGYWHAPQMASDSSPLVVLLAGDSAAPVFLRAYLRLVVWVYIFKTISIARKFRSISPGMGGGAVRKIVGIGSVGVDTASASRNLALKERLMQDLARQYLYEWRQNGTLPPVEGILLARA